MIRVLRVIAATAIVATVAVAAEPGNPSAVFGDMKTHYESIRLAFLNDSTEGIPEHAARIEVLATDLERNLTAEREELRRLLPTIRVAAARVASATTIEAGREAFGELSKSMVGYRQTIADRDSVVAFCSMAQQVWLQPKGEIGNPYYGQSMARCGEIVSE